ncbi:MAG: hypothetical protein PHQ14_10025 [Chromatiales bacterium]|jgi:hypothetical protein|nr:hypothetical protein [Chromatiales bacterium]MDX9766617.1 hypothetical protein [Ectothiorhodospiraceae bacterium]
MSGSETVLIVHAGNPRADSNSALLAERLADAARSQGRPVESVHVGEDVDGLLDRLEAGALPVVVKHRNR